MVNESFSELLQEGTQKSSPPAGETMILVTATPVHSPVDHVEEAASNPAEEDPTLVVEETTAEHTNQNKAELTMEQAHQNEASLGQQILDLQSALSEQKELAMLLKKELKEAKQAAIYLAEANSKPTKEVNTLLPEKNVNTLKKEKTNTLKPEQKTLTQTSFKKSYRKSEALPHTQPEGSVNSNQMWLLD